MGKGRVSKDLNTTLIAVHDIVQDITPLIPLFFIQACNKQVCTV